MNNLKKLYPYLAIVGSLLLILLFKEVLLTHNEQPAVEQQGPVKQSEPKKVDLESETPPKSIESNTPALKAPRFDRRFERFMKLKHKVLPNDAEALERETILSDLKIGQQVAAQLMKDANSEDVRVRLSMIDFLEDSIAWNENPVREDLISIIEGVIRSEEYLKGTKEAKRRLIGDKIELFAILTDQAPERAARLLEETEGTKIKPVLEHAIKRLSLKLHR